MKASALISDDRCWKCKLETPSKLPLPKSDEDNLVLSQVFSNKSRLFSRKKVYYFLIFFKFLIFFLLKTHIVENIQNRSNSILFIDKFPINWDKFIKFYQRFFIWRFFEYIWGCEVLQEQYTVVKKRTILHYFLWVAQFTANV